MVCEEFFDICDETGQPTGEIVSRSRAHREGICHRTAHIWVLDRTKPYVRILLQKRSADKDSFPGCYDTSSAGHVQAGDEPLASALRELEEELGISAVPEDLTFFDTFRIQFEDEFHGKPFRDDEVAFVYLYEKLVRIEELTLQKEEVESVRWFSLDEVYLRLQRNDPAFCVPADSIDLLRSHFYPHCCNERTRRAKKEIDAILQDYGPQCRIHFLRTTATLTDSWRVDSKEVRHAICRLIAETGVTKRSYENLSAEWEVHNLAYQMHIGRKHSADADLDYEKDPHLPVRAASDLFDLMDIE